MVSPTQPIVMHLLQTRSRMRISALKCTIKSRLNLLIFTGSHESHRMMHFHWKCHSRDIVNYSLVRIRHLAKTQLLCDAQIYLYSVNKRHSCVFARWRHSAMKFKKKVNDWVQHIILQKFTNFHAIRSWSFQNIYNEIGWPIGPVFLRHPVYGPHSPLCW